jgi:hypothetical protein
MAKRGLLETSALTPPTAAPPPVSGTGNNEALSQLGPSPQAPAEDAAPNVTAEEQEEYELVIDNAQKLLYSDPEVLMENVSQGDIVEGLANTVANVFSQISDSAKQNGVKFADGVILAASGEIMEDLADFITEAGIDDPTPEQMESAMYAAVDKYRELQQKNIDPNEAAGEFMRLQDAEKDGMLDQVAPGLSERFAQFQPTPEDIEALQQQPQDGQQAPAPTGPPQPKRGLAE